MPKGSGNVRFNFPSGSMFIQRKFLSVVVVGVGVGVGVVVLLLLNHKTHKAVNLQALTCDPKDGFRLLKVKINPRHGPVSPKNNPDSILN